MADLKLKAGERVRNINRQSNRDGWQGVIIQTRLDSMQNFYPSSAYYHVRYDNGSVQSYSHSRSSQFLERVGEKVHVLHAPCDPMMQLLSKAFDDYVTPPYSDLVLRQKQTLQGQPKQSARKVLKKIRRNVLTGVTQDDMVRDKGHLEGVYEFNTRALGRTTGQVFSIIGEAMCNPGKAINIRNIDHWISDPRCMRGASRNLNEHFHATVKHAVATMKGFTVTQSDITFNPIVTEETYVEIQ